MLKQFGSENGTVKGFNHHSLNLVKMSSRNFNYPVRPGVVWTVFVHAMVDATSLWTNGASKTIRPASVERLNKQSSIYGQNARSWDIQENFKISKIKTYVNVLKTKLCLNILNAFEMCLKFHRPRRVRKFDSVSTIIYPKHIRYMMMVITIFVDEKRKQSRNA